MRYSYALMMSGVLTHHGVIPQKRVDIFLELLKSLKLGDIRAALFEDAKSLTREKVSTALEEVKRCNGARNFILDILVVLGVEPISEEEKSAVERVATLQGIESLDFKELSGYAEIVCNSIKGIPPKNELSSLIVEYWPAKVPEIINPVDIANEANLNDRFLIVMDSIAVSNPWSASNCIFYFINNSSIKTIVEDRDDGVIMRYINCLFLDGIMEFQIKSKGLRIELENCEIRLDYKKDKTSAPFDLDEVKSAFIIGNEFNKKNFYSIKKCKFSSIASVCLGIFDNDDCDVLIEKSTFSESDSPFSIMCIDARHLEVIGSEFLKSSAITPIILNSKNVGLFKNCKFSKLISPAFMSIQLGGHIFESCSFQECDLMVGDDDKLKTKIQDSNFDCCRFIYENRFSEEKIKFLRSSLIRCENYVAKNDSDSKVYSIFDSSGKFFAKVDFRNFWKD